jgi:integrase/recombinase XerD
MASIYYRMRASKDAKGNWQADDSGGWRFLPVPEGQGRKPEWLAVAIRTAASNGRGFQIRINGQWSEQYKTIKRAQDAAETAPAQRAAVDRGLTPSQAVDPSNAARVPIKVAIITFLDKKRINASSIEKYTYILNEFFDTLPRTVRFVDQAETALHTYLRHLESNHAAPKTICDKILIVCFMLKAAGVDRPSKLVELPGVEEEKPDPYSAEDLTALFAAMGDEDHVKYDFFLKTACREQEVAVAQWIDIDWKSNEYHVRAKQWKASSGLVRKFTPKSHQSRRVPLTQELIEMLRARQKKSSSVWIFPNEEDQPEGHFLRKFKKIAYRAGLNCGQCSEGCKDDSEGCEKHYLHRLRSTRITDWLHKGIDVKTVMEWAGHKKMETTQIYAGSKATAKLQNEINAPMYAGD